uniref:ACB domain-containing protein n=1 Tax=Timema monikensis TaxID=170555 RepID=A0A7R9HU57_9NEOP|nr:unnamed protein product [Timema monikensis]
MWSSNYLKLGSPEAVVGFIPFRQSRSSLSRLLFLDLPKFTEQLITDRADFPTSTAVNPTPNKHCIRGVLRVSKSQCWKEPRIMDTSSRIAGVFRQNVINFQKPLCHVCARIWFPPLLLLVADLWLVLQPDQLSGDLQRRYNVSQKFNKAAEDVKNLTKRPSDGELLELYSLFKQATVGDNETPKPGLLDLKGKAKWEAWTGKKGMSQDAAKEAYISKAEYLSKQYS